MTRIPVEVDLADDLTTVTPDPAKLHAVYINDQTSSHKVIIKNGDTRIYKIPPSAAEGNIYPFGDSEFLDGIVIDPDDGASGLITVVYEPWNVRENR